MTPATALPPRTERLRVLWAFYQRQLFASSEMWHKRCGTKHVNIKAAGERMTVFSSSFEPWEFYQINDANRFVHANMLRPRARW